MHTAQQNPNIKKCADILSRGHIPKQWFLNRYGSTPEEAQKWGYVQKHLGGSAVPECEI